ncbi:MAG: DUF2085 domain-containing protein [Clostridiales bacterium]|nr:DUF2085 domain-containing protein [Clostridiales bacterium]
MRKISRFLQIFCGCHCRPDRSFFYKGRQFPVCARCTGVLLGYLLGILWLIVFSRWHIAFCLLACLPLIMDGIGQQKGKWESTNLRRLWTGLMLGMATINIFANYHHLIVWAAGQTWAYLLSK